MSFGFRDAWTELPGPVEEVLRSVEVALKRHTQLMETLIRSGVKIANNSSPGGSEDGQCDPRRRSPESSSAAEEDAAGTSSKLWISKVNL